ncbi:MAG: glycosyltransferase family 4 protein [Crocinitomicaceae bacterium]
MEGFGRFTFEVTKRLVENNPEHTFYFFFDRAFDTKFIFTDNVVPVVLSPQARHPLLFKIWFNWSVTNAIKKYKIDLFFSPDGYLSLRTNVPQVGVIHDLNFEHFPEDLPKRPLKYLKKHFPLFAKKAEHLLTVSEFSKQDIVNLYHIDPAKVTVAYNSANAIFKPQSDSVKANIKANFTNGESYFVYVGAIHARKNIQRLIKAFKLYKSQTKSKTKLLIVGDAMWENVIAKGNNDDVVYTGHVQFEKLAEIVGSARALCLVSYFEGFGIPLVEAMQSGVPVLAGNLTALPEVVGKAGILVDPLNIEAIANGIRVLDSDENLRAELIAKGLIQSQQFSWARTATVVEGVIFGKSTNLT